MLVKDLIKELEKYPYDTPVELATDGEGNDFRALSSVDYDVNSDGTEPFGNAVVTLWPIY